MICVEVSLLICSHEKHVRLLYRKRKSREVRYTKKGVGRGGSGRRETRPNSPRTRILRPSTLKIKDVLPGAQSHEGWIDGTIHIRRPRPGEETWRVRIRFRARVRAMRCGREKRGRTLRRSIVGEVCGRHSVARHVRVRRLRRVLRRHGRQGRGATKVQGRAAWRRVAHNGAVLPGHFVFEAPETRKEPDEQATEDDNANAADDYAGDGAAAYLGMACCGWKREGGRGWRGGRGFAREGLAGEEHVGRVLGEFSLSGERSRCVWVDGANHAIVLA